VAGGQDLARKQFRESARINNSPIPTSSEARLPHVDPVVACLIDERK